MPINLEGRQHNPKYEEGDTHKIEPIRLRVTGDIIA